MSLRANKEEASSNKVCDVVSLLRHSTAPPPLPLHPTHAILTLAVWFGSGMSRHFSVLIFVLQLDKSYSEGKPPHHIPESLSELTLAVYLARRLPLQVYTMMLGADFGDVAPVVILVVRWLPYTHSFAPVVVRWIPYTQNFAPVVVLYVGCRTLNSSHRPLYGDCCTRKFYTGRALLVFYIVHEICCKYWLPKSAVF